MKNIPLKYNIQVVRYGKQFEIRNTKNGMCLHKGSKNYIRAVISKNYRGIKFN
jgi:hypothetical protein